MWRTAQGNVAHTIIIMTTQTKTAMSRSLRKNDARLTRAGTLPLTVKVQNMRHSLRTGSVTGCEVKFCCNCKEENNSYESNDESYSPPPETGFTFTACRLPLSQPADGFQLLVYSGSSKHFINPELVHEKESRMLNLLFSHIN